MLSLVHSTPQPNTVSFHRNGHFQISKTLHITETAKQNSIRITQCTCLITKCACCVSNSGVKLAIALFSFFVAVVVWLTLQPPAPMTGAHCGCTSMFTATFQTLVLLGYVADTPMHHMTGGRWYTAPYLQRSVAGVHASPPPP